MYIYIYMFACVRDCRKRLRNGFATTEHHPPKKTADNTAVTAAVDWRARARARVRTLIHTPRKGLRNDPENFVFNYRHRRKLTAYLISCVFSFALFAPLPVILILNMISRVQWTELPLRSYLCICVVYNNIYYIGATLFYIILLYSSSSAAESAMALAAKTFDTHCTHKYTIGRCLPFVHAYIITVMSLRVRVPRVGERL